ncbi:hypothetical protein PCYB_146690 [Plasmodium cynomolgi strain B]|uniref:DUF7641 domain-containing protein n=1 Tax=Plasmodium cynomolgi (strain B) TaxID=1120755 RepID=K6UF01_PLACD|nr:hypothetical protein PCYB_146690 [Plasmodium cynomolgi strain B]GAB69241.1 hypothetical protein PCYB_146690 [Plasmodium cynomolgi strain B]
MDQIRSRLDHYQPNDKTKAYCRKYIFFVTFYTFFVLILLIYSFFSTKLSIYGWLLFTNLYFCVFPIFSFIGKSYIPSLLVTPKQKRKNLTKILQLDAFGFQHNFHLYYYRGVLFPGAALKRDLATLTMPSALIGPSTLTTFYTLALLTMLCLHLFPTISVIVSPPRSIFTYSAKDLSLMITYGVLTWVNTALCWKTTQSIFDGVRTQHSLLDNLNPKSNGKKGNNNDDKKWGLKKKFFGKGKTTKDSHYVEV